LHEYVSLFKLGFTQSFQLFTAINASFTMYNSFKDHLNNIVGLNNYQLLTALILINCLIL